jgi:hypothetical protein
LLVSSSAVIVANHVTTLSESPCCDGSFRPLLLQIIARTQKVYAQFAFLSIYLNTISINKHSAAKSKIPGQNSPGTVSLLTSHQLNFCQRDHGSISYFCSSRLISKICFQRLYFGKVKKNIRSS